MIHYEAIKKFTEDLDSSLSELMLRQEKLKQEMSQLEEQIEFLDSLQTNMNDVVYAYEDKTNPNKAGTAANPEMDWGRLHPAHNPVHHGATPRKKGSGIKFSQPVPPTIQPIM